MSALHDKRLAYENKRVGYLLKHLVPDEEERAEWAAQLRKWAHPYLTFDALDRDFWKYGNPPVRFKAGHVGGRDQLFDGSYWLNLSTNRLVESYFDRRHAARNLSGNDQLDFAYVINSPTVRGGVVIHTIADAPRAFGETVIDGTGTNEEGKPEHVTVQPYNSFARWVATRWRNKQSVSTPRRPSNAELLREMTAQTVLLLVHLEERFTNGGRITTTQEALAKRSGITLSTVKRSLKTLADRGLIESERGEHCVHIRIV